MLPTRCCARWLSPRGEPEDPCQLLVDLLGQYEGIGARSQPPQRRHLRGVRLWSGGDAIQRGLRRVVDPRQPRPTRTFLTSFTEGWNRFIMSQRC